MKYDPKTAVAKVTTPTPLADAELAFIDDDMCHVMKLASEEDAAAQAAQHSDPTLPLHPAPSRSRAFPRVGVEALTAHLATYVWWM